MYLHTYNNGDFYFGRNLDLDCSFGETVVITPRNFPLPFRHAEALERHYAMIAWRRPVRSPIYAERVNEKGLAMAGTEFPGNAFYRDASGSAGDAPDRLELASFEMIAWFLGKMRLCG